MKKKYRKAIFFVVFLPVYPLAILFGVVGTVCEWVLDMALDFNRWLTWKLKVRKYDD